MKTKLKAALCCCSFLKNSFKYTKNYMFCNIDMVTFQSLVA